MRKIGRSLWLSIIISLPVLGAPILRVQPAPTVKPGDPLLIQVMDVSQPPTGSAGEQKLSFYRTPFGYEALTGLPVESALGKLEVKVTLPGSEDSSLELAQTIEVVSPAYPSRELNVESKYVEPPPEIQKQLEDDRLAFTQAFSQPMEARLFQGNFVWPRHARVTAPYGDLRLFNGIQQSQHYGIDLEGRVGARVLAAQQGTVVLARDCFTSGRTVILYHGGGLYTAYFHLSKFLTRVGRQVKRGQALGRVGKTGRVTGPHLHWAVKVDGLYVNGETLLRFDFSVPTNETRQTLSRNEGSRSKR